MAGVPLAPLESMDADKSKSFAIAPQLREDFNAYIAATRSGSVPPTEGKGEPKFARMYPTETQPREELFRVMRRHYGIMLRWRKKLLIEVDGKFKQAGGSPSKTSGIAGLPGPLQARSQSRFQDIEDLHGAEQELVKEIDFLKHQSPEKFMSLDDPLAAGSSLWILPVLGTVACWVYLRAFPDVMREKQREWDTWVRHEWASQEPGALPAAAVTLFERYVHDSRAWFKPMFRGDVFKLAPDDESWFVLGGRDAERAARRGTLARTARQGVGAERANAQAELLVIEQEGQPLIYGGREPYQMWGYLRHRAIYHSGRLTDSTSGARQGRIEAEENERVLQKSRTERTAAEHVRHKEEVDKLLARNREVIRENRLDGPALQEFRRGTEAQMESENRLHVERLDAIRRQTRMS